MGPLTIAYAAWVRRVLLGVLSRLAQRLVYPVCGVAAHARHPVGVAIAGTLYAGVPQQVLNVLRVRAASEQDREGALPLLIPL